MCGIVGLYLKNPDLRSTLGSLFSPMLAEMSDRGPDSAGIAVYRQESGAGEHAKVTLYHPDEHHDWDSIAEELEEDLGHKVQVERASTHAIFRAAMDSTEMRGWVERNHPELRIMSSGCRAT